MVSDDHDGEPPVASPIVDPERCYRICVAGDARFDGTFFVGVTSTGIYCRPSCPARTPERANVRFYPSAAAAQLGGFRACKRCRPDATPGSPAWNLRADVVGRAMRMIADGVVDRDGVAGLASRLGYSDRHLHRLLVEEVGAGPLALARAQRATTARILIETTDLGFSFVAFAAGFASIRQFNDTVREVFESTPSDLRSRSLIRRGGGSQPSRAPSPPSPPSPSSSRPASDGALVSIAVRLPVRVPFDGDALLAFLAARAVTGLDEVVRRPVPDGDGLTYRRVLALPHGAGIVELTPHDDHVACTLRLAELADLGPAIARCRRIADLDADPVAIADVLTVDPMLAALVARSPGRRLPGAADGFELAVRAVIGQQVSVGGARTVAARLVAEHGTPVVGDPTLDRSFPTAEVVAEIDPSTLPMPRRRADAIHTLARAVAEGDLDLDVGADRARAVADLVALPGIGPWTAGYVSMRALGDPDVFLPTDLAVRRALESLGQWTDVATIERRARAWRPFRSYALMHLWASLPGPVRTPPPAPAPARAPARAPASPVLVPHEGSRS